MLTPSKKHFIRLVCCRSTNKPIAIHDLLSGPSDVTHAIPVNIVKNYISSHHAISVCFCLFALFFLAFFLIVCLHVDYCQFNHN